MTGSGAARFTMTDDGLAPGLWLIGIGPGDLDHMTERARGVARGCSKRYLEGYTAVLPPKEEGRLESVVGPWEKIMRDEVEGAEELLASARGESVALLVVGDPMQATTHIDLEDRCVEQGIGFHVIPGLSATALAVSLSGMQSYRFGRQVTLPFATSDYLPTSPLKMLCNNFENGLHSLVLLDLDPTPHEPSRSGWAAGEDGGKASGRGRRTTRPSRVPCKAVERNSPQRPWYRRGTRVVRASRRLVRAERRDGPRVHSPG